MYEETLAFQNFLSGVYLSTLIRVYQIGHGLYLGVVLIPYRSYYDHCLSTGENWPYGFVSWLSNGLTSLPVSMFARTRYFNTWILCGDPASS